MDEILLNLIVLAITGVVILVIFLLVRRSRQKSEDALRQLALEKGWTYEPVKEPLVEGFKLTTPRWALESVSVAASREAGPGSSEVVKHTRWQSRQRTLEGRMALIGPRPAGGANLGGLGGLLIQHALRLMLGDEAHQAEGLVETPAGSPEFQKRYLCLARQPEDMEDLLTRGVERMLLALPPGQPAVVKISPEGLQVELNGFRARSPQEIQTLHVVIGLGESLINQT